MKNVTQRAVIAAAVAIAFFPRSTFAGAVTLNDVQKGEDVFSYVKRVKGGFDQTLYRQVIGAANPYKEGDEAIGVAAGDDASRQNARALLANTKVGDLHDNPLFVDDQQRLIWKGLYSLGVAYWDMGSTDEARDSWIRSHELIMQAVERHPSDRRFLFDLSRSYFNLGAIAVEEGRMADAEARFIESLELVEKGGEQPDERVSSSGLRR